MAQEGVWMHHYAPSFTHYIPLPSFFTHTLLPFEAERETTKKNTHTNRRNDQKQLSTITIPTDALYFQSSPGVTCSLGTRQNKPETEQEHREHKQSNWVNGISEKRKWKVSTSGNKSGSDFENGTLEKQRSGNGNGTEFEIRKQK